MPKPSRNVTEKKQKQVKCLPYHYFFLMFKYMDCYQCTENGISDPLDQVLIFKKCLEL